MNLVLGTQALSKAQFIAHAKSVAMGAPAFDVNFTHALARPGHPDGAHVFLVPDQENDEILRLRDRLYAGPLAGELRVDLPFVPHMTVATVQDMNAADVLAGRMNADKVRVEGMYPQPLGRCCNGRPG